MPSSPVRFALLAMAVVGAGVPTRALDPGKAITQFRHDSWTTREGLPQSAVEAIAQTPDGYLWLGTQEGLARFDGVRFVVFDKVNTAALRHNRVVALLADRQGSLWIGTEGGGVARLQDGAWSAFGAAEGLPNPRVHAFAEDGAGRLFVGTDAGLAVWQGGRFVEVGPPALRSQPIEALGAGRDGLWVATGEDLLHLTGDVAVALPLPGRERARALWEDADGTLWVGTRDGLRVRVPGQPDLGMPPVTLASPYVNSILRDRHGILWIGTELGVVRFDGTAATTWNARSGLTNDQVMQVFEDREGSLWIGTQDGGLNRLADGPFTTWSTAEGLADDVVWPIFGDREGALWFGTKGGGLSCLKGGLLRTFSTAQGLSSNGVQALAQGSDGALWIGTRGGGLDRLVDGRVTAVYGEKQGLPGDSITTLMTARDGALWIGGRAGLARFADGAFQTWTARDGLPNRTIHSLLEAKDGALWIGTNGGGLVRMQDGVFRTFGAREGLHADIVNIVHEDADGTLWVGTFGGGLYRMRGERFTGYTRADGLYDDAIFSILEDARGRLWMSCNKGVFRVDKSELDAFDQKRVAHLEPVAYGTEDGMKNRECNGANFPPAWRGADGRLWFPTIQGAVVVDPEELSEGTPPVAFVEGISVDGTPRPRAQTLVLEPGENNFEVEYTVSTFRAPARVQFRHRLVGFDRDWLETGARRTAYYTNVPPGRYRFEVSARVPAAPWSPPVSGLEVELQPHFYQQAWFHLLAGLGLLALAGTGYRLRVRHLMARERKLAALVETRTRELQAATLSLTLLAESRAKQDTVKLLREKYAEVGVPDALTQQTEDDVAGPAPRGLGVEERSDGTPMG